MDHIVDNNPKNISMKYPNTQVKTAARTRTAWTLAKVVKHLQG